MIVQCEKSLAIQPMSTQSLLIDRVPAQKVQKNPIKLKATFLQRTAAGE